MNDTTIENILFRAPRPAAPPDLLKKIQVEIAVPAASSPVKARDWQNPLRRWFPALAFGVLMLSCAILVAVQANWSTNLKRQNEALRAATAALPQLREQHAALEQAQTQQDELVQLRKDNEEMHQLQTELASLRNLPAQIQRLQNENQRLSSTPASNANTVNAASFFDEAQQQAERIQCVNNLKQIGLAMRVWAGDNNDKYPPSLSAMTNELGTIKILICPSDTTKAFIGVMALGKGQITETPINDDKFSSYKFTVQPDDETYPDCIVARCPIHHNYLMADGSVQQVNPAKFTEVQKDGRWYLQNTETGAPFR